MASATKRDSKWRGWVQVQGFKTESRTFSTRRDALAWAEGREEELRRRRLSHPELLIDEIVGRYLREIEPKRGMAPSHAAHDIPSFRKRLNGLTLADLTGNGLMKWATAQQGVAASTRKWHISRLCGVLRQAEHHLDLRVPWEDMQRSLRKLEMLGLIEKARERNRRVTDDEVAAIKRRLPREVSVRMADIIDFCLQSCMRIGEVCRIEWVDLNEVDRTIVVRDRKHPTMKYSNHQVVPLVQGSFETLLRQPRRHARIFPHHSTNISNKFHRAAVRAGIDDVVLHDLRHEGISRLFELGFAIQEVALVSGHTNWRTLARYTHLKPQSLIGRESDLLAARKKASTPRAARRSPDAYTQRARAPQGAKPLDLPAE